MSDFKAKIHQIRFPLGFRPRSRWESLQRSPSPLAVFEGPTSKGREGEREGRGGKGRGERGKGRGRELPGQCQTAIRACALMTGWKLDSTRTQLNSTSMYGRRC